MHALKNGDPKHSCLFISGYFVFNVVKEEQEENERERKCNRNKIDFSL